MFIRSVFLSVAGALVVGATAAPGAAAAPPAQAPIPYDDSHALVYQITAAPLTPASAPADEYFGRMKLSNLGIRNIIHDITIEGNSPLALPKQQARIQAVSSAMIDWANKYPRDNWLPGAMVRFATMLQSKQQPLYDQTAISLWDFLLERYPNTWYSKYALNQLRKYVELPNTDLVDSADVHEVANVIDYTYLLHK